MIAYLLANWKQLGGVAIAFAALGWFAHRPAQPAVHELEQEHKAEASAVEVRKQEAPVRKTERDFARCPAAPGSPPVLVREVVTERGPVVTDTTKAEHQVEDRKLDLTITPAPRPGWAVGVGLEGLPADRVLRISLRRRLFGPFWAEVAVQPAARALGGALAVEW